MWELDKGYGGGSRLVVLYLAGESFAFSRNLLALGEIVSPAGSRPQISEYQTYRK